MLTAPITTEKLRITENLSSPQSRLDPTSLSALNPPLSGSTSQSDSDRSLFSFFFFLLCFSSCSRSTPWTVEQTGQREFYTQPSPPILHQHHHQYPKMSSALARPLMRRTNVIRNVAARRFESTASQQAKQTAEGAKNAAAEYKAKATEGLSRVTSAAGPAIAGAAKNVTSALGKVGGRTGRFIAFVERMLWFSSSCVFLPPSPTPAFGRTRREIGPRAWSMGSLGKVSTCRVC